MRSVRHRPPAAATRTRAAAAAGAAAVALAAASAPSARAAAPAPAGAAGAAPACRPAVLDYGALPGDTFSEILAGNQHGVLVGSSHNAAGRERAVRWVGRTPVDLGARSRAWAADINEDGVIVGNSSGSDQTGTTERAFTWRAGTLRMLPGLGGATFVRRINDRGVATGSAYDSGGAERPVTWRHGRLHRLGLPPAYEGATGLGINNAGDVVGAAYTADRVTAWFWPAGGTGAGRPLDRLGGFSEALVLDGQGRAYGTSDLGGHPGAVAAVWPRPGTVRGLGQLAAGDVSIGLGANGRGDVVGVGYYRPGAQRGHVLFTSVDRRRPRTLLPLSGDVRDDSSAHYVSENRPTAVGGSSEIGGASHATLWTCAERQAFEPPRRVRDGGTPAPLRPYIGGPVLRR